MASTFFFTGGTVGCHNDNLRCPQWRQICHHDNTRSSACIFSIVHSRMVHVAEWRYVYGPINSYKIGRPFHPHRHHPDGSSVMCLAKWTGFYLARNSLVSRLLQRSVSAMIASWHGNTLHITGPCEGNPPVTGGFPSKRAIIMQNFFIVILNELLN